MNRREWRRCEKGGSPLGKRDAEVTEFGLGSFTGGLFARRSSDLGCLEVVQCVGDGHTRIHQRQRREGGSQCCQKNLSSADLHRAEVLNLGPKSTSLVRIATRI